MKLSNKQEKMVKVILIVVVVLLLITCIGVIAWQWRKRQTGNNDHGNVQQNTSQGIQNVELQVNKVKAHHFTMEGTKDSTTIRGILENTVDKDIYNVDLKIKLWDKDDKLLFEYVMFIPNLNANEKREIETSIGANFMNAEKITAEAYGEDTQQETSSLEEDDNWEEEELEEIDTMEEETQQETQVDNSGEEG